MKLKYWWEKWPERLEFETSELDKCGILWERDEEAFARGTVLLHLKVAIEDKEEQLDVVFPSVYPYMRFEVYAPNLNLEHHQNPFQKNLCLLGRSTSNWHSSEDNVAKFIKERLPKVIETGNSNDFAIVKNHEEHQGEPISAYYPYSENTSAIIDSSWEIDKNIDHGFLEVGFQLEGTVDFRCVIIAVKDSKGNTVAEADAKLQSIYPQRLKGLWKRCDEEIRESDPKEFLEKAKLKTPIGFTNVNGRELSFVGVLYPEETTWRKKSDGWIFIVTEKLKKSFKVKKKIQTRFKILPYFCRPSRYGNIDVRSRIPEVSYLSEKKIAIVGLGCLGAPSALEFARNGIGGLRILDHDVIEAGTTVRWPFGLDAVGKRKTVYVEDFIKKNYPYTDVIALTHCIGEVSQMADGKSDLDVLEELLNDVDLVFDASAEIGIEHLLSDLAAERDIPYIRISTTEGASGGIIARIHPGVIKGCWRCFMLKLGNSIPVPLLDDNGTTQPVGCADTTFTGASFDTMQIVLGGVRLAVSTLLKDKENSYPDLDWDVAVINLRDEDGKAVAPEWNTYVLDKHDACICNGKA